MTKEVEWSQDQMNKEHQQELNFVNQQLGELRRNSQIQQQEVRDQVEKLWRSKIIEKDSNIAQLKEEIDSESRNYRQMLTTKEYESKDLSNQLNELKIKLISIQAENDDLSSKITIGGLDQNNKLESQKLKIEKLTTDLESNKTVHREQVRDLQQQLDKVTQTLHSKDIEFNSFKERSQYEAKSNEERLKLENERLENNYKFQLRKIDDKLRDQEREIDRLRFKDDTSNNKIIELERKLSQNKDKKDQEWQLRLESIEREVLDSKHNLQEKTNKVFLIKEKLNAVELNLEAKTNEVKKLRFDIKELEQRNNELEELNHALRAKSGGEITGTDTVQIKQLQRQIKELENKLRQQKTPEVVKEIVADKAKIPFVEKPYKKSKGSAFDDLGLDDDLSEDSLLREGSQNESERLMNLKPEKDTARDDVYQLKEENLQLKALISQMRDDMVNFANEKYPEKDKTASELNFFRNTNKKLLSQIDSEKERFEIFEKELDIKCRELEIANSNITNLSKKLSQKGNY